MADLNLTKRALISKTNSRTVLIVSVAAFVSIFCLVATKTLFSQFNYQAKVITEKRKAADQLSANIANVDKLKISYDAFVGSTTNALNGNSTGVGPKDGDNAKLVLDALPSAYDFPATVTSIEVLATQVTDLASIGGTDNEAEQASNMLSAEPQPVEIAFDMSAKGTYTQIQELIGLFERSIRPIKITTIDISGEKDELTAIITGTTYYQPGKSLNNKTTVVK